MSGWQKTTTDTRIPEWQKELILKGAQRSQDELDKPPLTMYGMDTAALTGMQKHGMQNVANAARAFGLLAPENALAYLPPEQENALGIRGYSSGLLYDEMLAELEKRYPGLLDYQRSLFIDPVTGQPGSRTFATADAKKAEDSKKTTDEDDEEDDYLNAWDSNHGTYLSSRKKKA